MPGSIFILFLSLTAQSHSYVIAEDKHMIVGGIKADIKDYPYQAAILHHYGNYVDLCGGVIIGKKWILSAAHCFSDKDTSARIPISKLEFAVEYMQLDQPCRKLHVTKVHIHPEYKALKNDIALVELSEELQFNEKVDKVTLPSPKQEYQYMGKEHKVVVSGIGVTKENGTEGGTLRAAEVHILNDNVCKSLEVYEVYNERKQLCAGMIDGSKDSCSGDSGGPLVHKNEDKHILLGIVSYGVGCGKPGVPGVYTRVSSYLDWIHSTTRSRENGR